MTTDLFHLYFFVKDDWFLVFCILYLRFCAKFGPICCFFERFTRLNNKVYTKPVYECDYRFCLDSTYCKFGSKALLHYIFIAFHIDLSFFTTNKHFKDSQSQTVSFGKQNLSMDTNLVHFLDIRKFEHRSHRCYLRTLYSSSAKLSIISRTFEHSMDFLYMLPLKHMFCNNPTKQKFTITFRMSQTWTITPKVLFIPVFLDRKLNNMTKSMFIILNWF